MKNLLHLVAYRLLVLAVLLSCLPLVVWGQSTQPQGDGQQSSPYEITTLAELLWVADQVNNQSNTFEDEFIVLCNDITLEDKMDGALIGVDSGPQSEPFNGHFDGQGYAIKNFDVVSSPVNSVSVFMGLNTKGTIQNLGVEICESGIEINVNSGELQLGILCGLSAGTIRNCYVTGGDITIHSNNSNALKVGSLLGWVTGGSVENCYSTVNISCDGNPRYLYMGGLISLTVVPCLNCYYMGDITAKAENTWDIGGLVGLLGGHNMAAIEIKNSLVYGNITIEADERFSDSFEGRIWAGQNRTDEATGCENNYAACNINLSAGIAAKTPYERQDGEVWSDLSSVPAGLFTGDSWDIPQAGVMPRLKLYGSDKPFPTQPAFRISDRAQMYEMTKATIEYGSVTSSVSWYVDGETASFTVTPDADYEVDAVTVTDASGNELSVANTGSDYSFTMPGETVTVSATFKKQPTPDPDPTPDPTPDPDPTPTPDPDPVFHEVTLPEVEGLISDPVPGIYQVEAWSSFHFYLTLQEGYEASVPVVTTSRGETITPRTSDGAYLVKYVVQPLTINISGVEKAPEDPTSTINPDYASTKVWMADRYLHIVTQSAEQVYIYTAEGRLYKAFRVAGGEEMVSLTQGVYMVKVGSASYKVIVR